MQRYDAPHPPHPKKKGNGTLLNQHTYKEKTIEIEIKT